MALTVTHEGQEGIERDVDQDIDEFERWFYEHIDSSAPLLQAERAIIKTYLGWKLGVHQVP